ncbi:MAG TPA: futalosine hydrolase [Hanamia sp.]|nr:futalosine hydrolase [Hanamia sp.]
MKVLIVAATEFEIKPLIQAQRNVEMLITGIGSSATIYHLTKKLLTNHYDLVIQAGIAGMFAGKFTLGAVVFVKEDAFADIGIEEKGELRTFFEYGFLDKNEFPFSDGKLLNPSAILEKIPLPAATAITVNMVSDNFVHNENFRQKYHADIESMEGAAFHYVCLQHKINFLQVRSLSNVVGERDKSRWVIDSSIRNLNDELVKIIDNFK